MKVNIDLPDNVELNFNATGVEVSVSLNIPNYLKSYISPNNLYKGKSFYLYKLSYQLESKLITRKNILDIYNMLLLRLMTKIREYKSTYYQLEANRLKQQSYKQLNLNL